MKNIIKFFLRNVPRPVLQKIVNIAVKPFVLIYKGNKIECPVCDKKYRKLLPYGYVNSRENALCPNCLSLERHRLMHLFLERKTNFFKDNLKVLHVAPEYCFIDRFDKLPNLDYITGDLESPLAKVKMDVHDIPFDANTFDVVFCNHVLEHVDDDVKVLKEFYRVLKKGGWAILVSPIDLKYKTTYEDPSITDPLEREKHFGQKDHVRMYGQDYKQRLEMGGFKVIPDRLAFELSKEERSKYALPEEEVFYCIKE
jgi:SAM-dependent methyltransferase